MTNDEKKNRLCELEMIFDSMHAQKPLSDSVKQGEKWVWNFEFELATILPLTN